MVEEINPFGSKNPRNLSNKTEKLIDVLTKKK